MTNREHLRAIWDHLQATYRIKSPLALRFVAPMNDSGSTALSGNGKITTCIRATDTFTEQCDSVLHEFAHVREIDRWREHSDEWSKYNGENYRTWDRWMNGIEE